MKVKNYGDFISVDDDFCGIPYELLAREEALQLIEDLTEAVKQCPARV